mmetsp:Transcript_36535/g.103016  ORF Transcript_36535/g.103016 Transcript_36535/m.103016 type:complete len:225 (-) Transcript_36535:24-698(-)
MARSGHGVHRCHQGGGAVHHGGIDHITFPRRLGLKDATHHAKRHEHPSATEVANEVEWRNWLGVLEADGVQSAGEADVIDVVPGGVGHGSRLAPARHPAINEFRVARRAGLGADAKLLHDAWAEALNEAVGHLAELEYDVAPPRLLEVHDYVLPAPVEDVGRVVFQATPPARRLDSDHCRPHVREHHAAVRARANPSDLHDGNTFQRARHCANGCAWELFPVLR